MKIEKLLITPTIARGFLEQNINNRPIKMPVVLRYMQDMQEGRWKEDTAEMIKISVSNKILDGQHRLMAVVKANTAINFHIATGLQDEIFTVLDTGSTRSASDVFNINKIKGSNQLPSVIQLYETLKSGRLDAKNTQKNTRKTNDELLSLYLERTIFYDETTKMTSRLYESFSKILAPQFIGGLYTFFYDINAENAKDFITQLCTGSEITNSVILLLRNKLIADRLSVKKMTPSMKVSLIIKTWNFYRKNQEVIILKYDPEREGVQVAI